MLTWLKGKRTYIACAGGILVSLGSYLSGAISLPDFVLAVFAFLGGMGLRAGVAK